MTWNASKALDNQCISLHIIHCTLLCWLFVAAFDEFFPLPNQLTVDNRVNHYHLVMMLSLISLLWCNPTLRVQNICCINLYASLVSSDSCYCKIFAHFTCAPVINLFLGLVFYFFFLLSTRVKSLLPPSSSTFFLFNWISSDFDSPIQYIFLDDRSY